MIKNNNQHSTEERYAWNFITHQRSKVGRRGSHKKTKDQTEAKTKDQDIIFKQNPEKAQGLFLYKCK